MARTGLQAALLLTLAASLAACDGAPAHSRSWRHSRTGDEAAQRDAGPRSQERAESASHRRGTLRIRLEVEPQQLDPLVDPDTSGLHVVDDTVFESLLRYDAPESGGPGAITAGLAASYRVAADGREIRVALRDGVTFHDGHPFSAVDAQFSLDAARAPIGRAAHLRGLLADVLSVDLWGPRDLRITLRRANGYVLRALAEVPMLPSHLYGSGDLAANPRNRAPIGTGPYRFVRWDRGERIVLARNETYWGAAPAIEEVEFVIEPDGAQALVRAQRSQLDVLPALIPEHFPEQAQAPGVADSFVPVRLRPLRIRYLVVNARQQPFDDVRVRRAVALIVPRDQIAEEVAKGLARPVAGPVWPGGPGDGAGPEPPALDLAGAAALLDDAGWRDVDGDGVRERGPEKLHAAVLVTSDTRGDAERDLLLGSLRRAGFVLEVRAGDPAYLMGRLRAGDFDAAALEWRGRVDDDVTQLVVTGGALNFGGFSSPTVDSVCASVLAAWDPRVRAGKLGELAHVLAAEAPIVPLTAPDPYGLVHKRVTGLRVWDGWFAVRSLALDPAR